MPASRLMTNARAVRNMTASNQHAELPGAREKTQRYDERRRTRRWVSYPEQYHHAAREPQPEGCGGSQARAPQPEPSTTRCRRRSKNPLSSTGFQRERATGVEPATSSLGSWHSTTELRPHRIETLFSRARRAPQPGAPGTPAPAAN